jgi:hypothetical protein
VTPFFCFHVELRSEPHSFQSGPQNAECADLVGTFESGNELSHSKISSEAELNCVTLLQDCGIFRSFEGD